MKNGLLHTIYYWLRVFYWTIIRHDLKRGKNYLQKSTDITEDEKRLLDLVSLKINLKDTMYVGGKGIEYLSVGLSAIRGIHEALCSTEKEFSVKSILDFAGGSGRVLRFLRVKFPNSNITLSELDQNALDFCRKNFSVTPLLSTIPFRNINLSQKFDLIWCGSLFTHIDEQSAIDLLKFFHDHLTDNGVCVFTTHGTLTIKWLEEGKKTTYGIHKDSQNKIVKEYYSLGYGYTDYQNEPGYGISVVSRKRLDEMAKKVGNWNEIMFLEHGWDNHQDIYSFSKQMANQK